MPDLDELILTEPRDRTDTGLAASRTLRRDISVRLEGFHWTACASHSRRVRGTDGWNAHAALGGEVIARGTVTDVRVDDRDETATLAVAPPARMHCDLEPARP
jgi:hypothetical protein